MENIKNAVGEYSSIPIGSRPSRAAHRISGAAHFHITISLGDWNSRHLTPENEAAFIAELIKHRAPLLFGGGGVVDVHVTPEAQPERKENH